VRYNILKALHHNGIEGKNDYKMFKNIHFYLILITHRYHEWTTDSMTVEKAIGLQGAVSDIHL